MSLPSTRAALWGGFVLACAAMGCTTKQQLVDELRNATQQQHLPEVVACWEREFEAAGFQGKYDALIDFTVELGSGKIRDVTVRSIEPVESESSVTPTLGTEPLARCIEKALADANLSRGGFAPSTNVTVRDFRLRLADASSEARKDAAEQTPNILIGPRADRCLGLYTHEPPRDAAALIAELARAEQDVDKVEPSNLDGQARALQRVYDLALELADSLRRDLGDDDLSPPSRRKMLEQIRRAEAIARRTGRAIGCKPPPPDTDF